MNSSSRFEWKVGLFVFFGLVLAAALMLNFSKGITLFQPTYELHLIMPTVAGLKPNAEVMMAGVPVGKVASTTLSPDGKTVNITLRILGKYKIYPESRFFMDSMGFLGDQYIAIAPPEKIGTQQPLAEGATIEGEAPFNLQEAVRSTAGLLDQARQTMKDLDLAITNVNRTLLNEQTLADFGKAFSNFQAVTETALYLAKDAQGILHSNAPAAHAAITNLNAFSEKLNQAAGTLDELITTNRDDVTAAVKNLRAASGDLKEVAKGLQAGKGLAGGLLKDEELKAQTESLIRSANALAANLNQFSSNLNQKGLWSMLKRPKQSATAVPPNGREPQR